MKVLHITPKTNGYEEVILLANRINRKNRFIAIERDGKKFITGGIVLNDDPQIREVLDRIPKKDQYDFARKFRETPFVKMYLEKDNDDKL